MTDLGRWVPAVLAGLMAGGTAMLGMAIYYQLRGMPHPPRRNPKRLGLLGGLTLVIAGGARARLSEVRPHAPPELSNARRFESTSDPALRLVAPPDWNLSYDAERRAIRAIKGPNPESATVLLDIKTDLLEQEVDAKALQQGFLRALGEEGFEQIGTLVTTPIAGLPAPRVVARKSGDKAEFCFWVVRRGRHYVADLTCVAHEGSCVVACQPALQQLTWLTPVDIAPSDAGG